MKRKKEARKIKVQAQSCQIIIKTSSAGETTTAGGSWE